MSTLKQTIRPQLIRQLGRAFQRTGDPVARQLLWRRIRSLDDRWDTHTRRLMREWYDIEIGWLTYGAFRWDGSITGGTRIGSFCSIAPGVHLGPHNHPLDRVSTHPFQFMANRGFVERDDEELLREMRRPAIVEDDVWIGVNAVVLAGVRVRRGAVVAAGSVVTQDVAPYTIVAGMPAKPIRTRLPAEQAERLAAIDWPDWSEERLRAELEHFKDVEAFLERHGGEAAAATPTPSTSGTAVPVDGRSPGP